MKPIGFKFPGSARSKIIAAGIGVAVLSVIAVSPAHSQFGIDIAAILAGLKEINSTLNSAVAAPLKEINLIEQQEQRFQQQVLYPLAAINSAKQMATSFSSSFTSFRQLGTMNISSAQLPTPQQLEQQMLSANPNNIGRSERPIRRCSRLCQHKRRFRSTSSLRSTWVMRRHRTRSRKRLNSMRLPPGKWKSPRS